MIRRMAWLWLLGMFLGCNGGAVQPLVRSPQLPTAPALAAQLTGEAQYLGLAYDAQVAATAEFQAVTAAFGAVASPYAVAPPGGGNLASAYVFRVVRPVEVWRAYSEQDWNGRWWAPARPTGTKEQYRQDYAICPEFNTIRHLIRCRLEPGTLFAAGPGNSVRCQDGRALPASPRWQLFLPLTRDKTRVQVLTTEAPLPQQLVCTEAWRVGQTLDELEPIPVPSLP